MVGWVINTGGPPMVAPPGGRDPVVGTNPIGIGIPATDSPVIVDMATSKRAWGEVSLAKRFHDHSLPPDSFIDSEGVPTLNPELAHAALPMGGYKGFGLGLLIEILGGSLVGMDMGKGEPNEAYYARDRGALILVINPEMTVGSSKFKADNQDFITAIKRTPAAQGSDGVTLPGDRAMKTNQENGAKGYLEIDDVLWDEITRLL
jgi:LDH2 family malate/lactate/ureidoglycolate dehydrogenase